MKLPPISIELTDRAVDDLRAIRDYIAKGDLAAAVNVIDEALRVIEVLRVFPELGGPVPGDPAGARAATLSLYPAYRVFYEYDASRARLRVLRVLHGARHSPPLVRE